jgi:hypothetical protein
VQWLVLLVGAVVAPMVYPAAPLDPQFLIVAQFMDAEGPVVRLANGRVFRLDKLPAPIVVKPGVPIEPPAQIIDLFERRQPGALPRWFKTPPKPGRRPTTQGADQDVAASARAEQGVDFGALQRGVRGCHVEHISRARHC